MVCESLLQQDGPVVEYLNAVNLKLIELRNTDDDVISVSNYVSLCKSTFFLNLIALMKLEASVEQNFN